MITINTIKGALSINTVPKECPFCHKGISAQPIYGQKGNNILYVWFQCPTDSCMETFTGYYKLSGSYYVFQERVSLGNLTTNAFNKSVSGLSEGFVNIYTQAFAAEQQSLTEICGVGYRKALEFLIKDYLIIQHPEKKEIIEKKLLGPCISEFVNDERIKKVAKRAVWLGNDETHYIRKWEGKDLNDLKILIDLTVHWIEMEVLTNQFEEDMPD
jgi:hypothetical protein